MVSRNEKGIVDLIVMIGFMFGFAAGIIARGMWESRESALMARGCPNFVSTSVLPGVGGGDPSQPKE